MNWHKTIPLTQALLWIVGSLFVVTGGGYSFIRYLQMPKEATFYEPVIYSLIQTGPQKMALSTEYLAEVLHLSQDQPLLVKQVDLKKMEHDLLGSPLIQTAHLKLLKPGTLYVDYTVRQPVAWLEDYVNVVIDKEGYPFPFTPFFSPKNLPKFYLGLGPFGAAVVEEQKPLVRWNAPLEGKLIDLCFSVLNCVQQLKVCDQFSITRIDVSHALSPSCGKREIVVTTEDSFMKSIEGRAVQFRQVRRLRLSVKNFAQELGNYLTLRKQLLREEEKTIVSWKGEGNIVYLKEKALDFRIPNLAFIQE